MSTAPKAAPGTVAISDARPRRCMSAAGKPWKASRSLRPSNSPTPAFGSTSLALVRSTGAGCLYAVFMARPAIQRRLNAAVIMLLKWTNDIAKYFAIIPAAFAVTYPALGALNIMRLHSPTSAILSAVIFNALIIVALIPLALKGVKYRAEPADRLLSRSLLIYGVGGELAPFLGIKLIDLILSPFM